MSKNIIICVFLVCVMLVGCATHSTSNAPVKTDTNQKQPIKINGPVAGKSFYIQTTGKGPYTADNLAGTVTAYLQSDKNMSIASTAQEADYAIDITIVDMSLTDKQAADIALRDVAVPILLGTVGGAVVGSVGNNSGPVWGAGIGAVLGLVFGMSEGRPQAASVWSMLADVTVKEAGVQKTTQSTSIIVTADGRNMTEPEAIPVLENRLAQEIIQIFP